jgi:ABC-type lipoprotein release transport system permease subunit
MLGTRYLRATQGRGFLSFISVVSVLGLAIGVAVLIVVLSVMNGFERELKTRILSVTSHATLMGLDGTLHGLAGRSGAGAEDAGSAGRGAVHRSAGAAHAR